MHDFDNYKKIKVPINGEEHTLYVADSPEKRTKGLSNLNHIPFKEGMIFVYSSPVQYSYTMENTHVPLEMIFISEDFEIIQQVSCKPKEDIEICPWRPYKYVIEVS
tara:strand:- start:154 stop:471 length:318 start_codon:yes stop_codon:yes gene_type:complete